MDRHNANAETRDVDIELGRAWREHRRHVLDIAFRMLGNLSEAEDAAQEAFARLVRADLEQIDDVGGWLVTVVSRICLDELRSQRRHPTAPDPALGALPADASLDPADRVTLDDNVRIALHLVLERLSPAERTAFVLHDVFQYPFDAVADIVGRSPAACRQLASRARRTIAADVGGPARFRVEPAEHRLVIERFITAASTGDLDGLLAILDPDVAGVADVGGRVGVVTVTGAAAVAAATLRFLGPDSATILLSLPAGDASEIVAVRDGHAVSLVTLRVHDGRIDHIDGIIDPVKLAPIADALGLSTPRTRRVTTMDQGINLQDKLDTITQHWAPRTIATFNQHDVMVVKVQGEFVWHIHADTDDFFLVLSGHLVIRLRDRAISSTPASCTSSRPASSIKPSRRSRPRSSSSSPPEPRTPVMRPLRPPESRSESAHGPRLAFPSPNQRRSRTGCTSTSSPPTSKARPED